MTPAADPLDRSAGAPPPGAPVRRPAAEPGLVDLLKELRDETSTLVRQEVALAKAEVGEKASVYAANGGKIAAGAALAFAAVVTLVAMLAIAVYFLVLLPFGGDDAETVGHLVAGLIGGLGVPLLVLGLGYALIKGAVDKISRTSPLPEKTIASLKADAAHLKTDAEVLKQKVTS